MNLEFRLARAPFSEQDARNEQLRTRLRPIVRSSIEEEILKYQAELQSDHEPPAVDLREVMAKAKAEIEARGCGYEPPYQNPFLHREAAEAGVSEEYEHLAELIASLNEAEELEAREDLEDRPIAAGDVVFLISGGLPMTVSSIETFPGEPNQAALIWQDEAGAIRQARIETRLLER